MRICPNCKTSHFDMDTKCNKCGYPLRVNPYEKVVVYKSNTADGNPVFVVEPKKNTLSNSQRVSKFFMSISCVLNMLIFLSLVAFLSLMDTFFASILDAVSVLDVVKMFDVVNTFEFYFVKIKIIISRFCRF